MKTHFPQTGGGNNWVSSVYEPPVRTTGNVFYVCSAATGASDAAGYGRNPESPFATLAYALTQATANNGDVIVLMEGHTETIASAGAITCSTAGVRILGLGRGSLRPTFTWSATDSTWLISAANVSVENIRCTISIDEVVTLFSVTAAWARLDGVDYVEASAKQAISFLLTNASADDLEICNCRHVQVNAAAATQDWIILIGADRAHIHHNYLQLALKDVATGASIQSVTTAPLQVNIHDNVIYQTGYAANLVSAILMVAGTTGFIWNNKVYSDQAAIAGAVAAASCACAENYCLNTVNKSGILDPVADA